MILGTGIDLIDIRRIADTLERHGARFKDRIFTQAEQDWCEKRSDKAAAYARHYAVKRVFFYFPEGFSISPEKKANTLSNPIIPHK